MDQITRGGGARNRGASLTRRARARRPGIDVAVWMGAVAVAVAAVAFFALYQPPAVGDRVEPIDTIGVESSNGGPAGSPRVGWIDAGERIFITTHGSGSCPTVPTSLHLTDGQLVIGLTHTTARACTEDLAPASYVIQVPSAVRGQSRLEIVVRDEDGTTHEAVIE
ncbi:hypothetical protein [Clavibacter zhangzhiyongii]|uniref:hypothetical protein n=1 Tax=Clavibacter zhangzhiyongii TaxID=2768071 RepID=UPI0039DFFE83